MFQLLWISSFDTQRLQNGMSDLQSFLHQNRYKGVQAVRITLIHYKHAPQHQKMHPNRCHRAKRKLPQSWNPLTDHRKALLRNIRGIQRSAEDRQRIKRNNLQEISSQQVPEDQEVPQHQQQQRQLYQQVPNKDQIQEHDYS